MLPVQLGLSVPEQVDHAFCAARSSASASCTSTASTDAAPDRKGRSFSAVLPIRRLTRTYYENGQVATECLEQYIEGTRSYTTYDESGNQTGYEYTEQTGN